MTLEESKNLNLGLYLIFWKSGGMSKAVVSKDANGVRMVTCHNWTGGRGGSVLSYYVHDIARMVFIF